MQAEVLASPVHVGFKRILVATDFSAASQHAAALARSLAQRFGSEVLLVHVLPAESGPPWASRSEFFSLHEAAEEAMADAAEAFDDLPCTAMVERGSIELVLADLAHKHRSELFVLGAHGRGFLSKLALGSTAEHMIRTATCPVITVGPTVEVPAQGPLQIERLLFITDLSAEAMAALPWATALAAEFGAQLLVGHFVHPDIRSPYERYRLVQESEAAIRRELGAAQAEVVVEFEHASKGIPALAHLRHTQLIVLGIKHGAFARAAAHLPTRVIDGVLMQAPCPVFTVCPTRQAPR